MSGDVVHILPEPPEPHGSDDEFTGPQIGARLRSTMAAEYAAPYLAEINRLQEQLDQAVKARADAQRLAKSMAERVATEHARRVAVERELSLSRQLGTERERVERMMEAAVALRPTGPPSLSARVRRAWHDLTRPR